MPTETIFSKLFEQENATKFLNDLRLTDLQRSKTNLVQIAKSGIPLDLLASVLNQLAIHLPQVSDPDMSLNNLERFIAAARSPLALGALLERDPTAMPILLRIFSASQYLSDLLISDTESYDLLRMTEGQPIARATLIEELDAELSNVTPSEMDRAAAIIRRFKKRETLRIAFGDLIARQDLETVTTQISYLADAICQATLSFCIRRMNDRCGHPLWPNGTVSKFVVLALGKLGGNELNYSSDIDLILVYESEGKTDGSRSVSNREYFEALARDFVKLLSGMTPDGQAYRVDLRLRPGGEKSPMVISYAGALTYYDVKGRTWERQAMVKARAIAGTAGDLSLGYELLRELSRWIYVSRFTMSDIVGIKALKRQIERRTVVEGQDERDVKTGRGGIRDIEFAVQFMQLLHGNESTELRTGNTLEALSRLYEADCITSQEQIILERGYRWLRKLEHRLQIMFDIQTHSLPDGAVEQAKLARRMDYSDAGERSAFEQFQSELDKIRDQNRSILDHLLHDAFDHLPIGRSELGDASAADPSVPYEVDLILDANPSPEWIEDVLRRYQFVDIQDAYRNLNELATERNSFLSPRRCRHFLAAIAPQLLKEISETPDPDETLRTLNVVSETLGGKAALWELFSNHPPSMRLYVTLCGATHYLSNILISNPGMLDGLLDSMIMEDLPSFEFLDQLLTDRLRGAEDISLILHRFRIDQHLRIGVRDILKRDKLPETHRALSDVAELCLREVASREFDHLCNRYGTPKLKDGEPCELLILALGKLGGREPNYHSDLDLIFLYSGEGKTETSNRSREPLTNQDFFSRLAANITKFISSAGPHGKLYEVDSRLRPTGKSGSLAVSLKEFQRYFFEGDGHLWERLALCKARAVYGSEDARADLMKLVSQCLLSRTWQPAFANEIFDMRLKMEHEADPQNIKRGVGGTVDVEFVVQMLQLRWLAEHPEVLVPGTLAAAECLRELKLIDAETFALLHRSYSFLRGVESAIRLMDLPGRHDVPQTQEELARLGFLLGDSGSSDLAVEIEALRKANRQLLGKMVEQLASE